MTLGLDLAGGVHFVLEVAMDEAIAKQVRDESARATHTLRDAGIRYVGRSEDMVSGTTVRVPFKDPQVRDEALALLTESIARDLDCTDRNCVRTSLWKRKRFSSSW